MRNIKHLTEKAFDYYCKGLTSQEIGKLLDISHRTVQNYMGLGNWKAKRQALQEAEKETTKNKVLKEYKKELAKTTKK